jgi:hypothetical protein
MVPVLIAHLLEKALSITRHTHHLTLNLASLKVFGIPCERGEDATKVNLSR